MNKKSWNNITCFISFGLMLSSKLNVYIFTCEKPSKESAYNTGNPGWIPGLGRCPGGRNIYTFQYSCLENSVDRRASWTTVREVCKEFNTTEQLTNICLHVFISEIAPLKCIFKYLYLFWRLNIADFLLQFSSGIAKQVTWID